MTTELTKEKVAEIRQRYSPKTIPKCHICGAEMTVQRMSASRITYGCSGATYDETGYHYAEGRSIADCHYEQSRVTVVDVSDPDVLELVEALEARDKQIAELRAKDINVKRQAQALFDAIQNPDDAYIPAYVRCLRNALAGVAVEGE